MRPLGDRVLVELDESPNEVHGIIVPEAYKEKNFEGVVLAIGPAVTDVKVGYRVFVGKFAGIEFTYNEKPCLIIREGDIIAQTERVDS
jgi:co-chaperonin GroES (HSP10)